MNKKNISFLLIGLIIGWLTTPILQANEDDSFHTYKQALKVMISLMQDIKNISQQTADNIKAIKEKLGAK